MTLNDGRARTAPEYAPGTLAPEEFQDQYCEAVVRAIVEEMPDPTPPEGLAPVDARLYHGTFMKYFSFFAWRFPSWLMAVAAQCPYQDVRAGIIKDCVDEEVGDPDANGRCHVDVLYDEAAACGVTRDEIVSAEPSIVIKAVTNALEHLAHSHGWLYGFAALSALEVMSSEPAMKIRTRLTSQKESDEYGRKLESKTLHEKLDVPVGSLNFFELHSYKDRFHGGGELKLLVKYAYTRELQEQVIDGGRAGAQMFALMMQEITRLSHAEVGLEAPKHIRSKLPAAV